MSTFMGLSGLLLDAFAEGGEDAVGGAPAARSCYSACWIPVSGRQEGTVVFLHAYYRQLTQPPVAHKYS